MTAIVPFRIFTQPVDQIRSGGLDALRFLFAMWVLLAHGVSWAVYTGALNSDSELNQIRRALIWIFQRNGETHPAVLAFIVLSGYCIHRNGFRLHRAFSLTAFGVRRFFRIYPVYLFASVIGVLFWFVNANFNIVATKALTGTESITDWGLFVKITGISSFIPSLYRTGWQGNAPLTTAMVETWLYVFYGFVVWYVASGFRVRTLVLGLAILWFLTFWHVYLNQEAVGWWHNGSFISFALYWWIGAVFAECKPLNRKQKAESRKWYTVALLIALCLVVIGSLGENFMLVEIRKIGISTLFGFAIKWSDHHWRKKGILAKAGLTGYCIYALHAPLMIFLLINGVSLVLAISVVLIASVLCHLVFERPLLEFGKRVSARAVR